MCDLDESSDDMYSSGEEEMDELLKNPKDNDIAPLLLCLKKKPITTPSSEDPEVHPFLQTFQAGQRAKAVRKFKKVETPKKQQPQQPPSKKSRTEQSWTDSDKQQVAHHLWMNKLHISSENKEKMWERLAIHFNGTIFLGRAQVKGPAYKKKVKGMQQQTIAKFGLETPGKIPFFR